ncbi:hypothetical protein Nepgr_019634 [Nepenthes gracilis]|uniref:Uncharacterized protein n=1 Tax=Nepenthes gracilis TaxID=150966 RepID=A0AAD3STU6_NEPGR|nr:hypothetical protein Nepgr_019634 [Nepenthes gracilis]
MVNISDPHKGKVFIVGGHVNGTDHGNDKLVNVDGNLIIHSVFATKKARASSATEVKRAGEESSLALVGSSGLPCSTPRVSLNPGSIVLAAAATIDTVPKGQKPPQLKTGRNRRILHVHPIPLGIASSIGLGSAAATIDTVPKGQKPPQLKTGRNRRILHVHPIPLGIASSIGLGSGLHTFVLYLGPHIAQFAIKALL